MTLPVPSSYPKGKVTLARYRGADQMEGFVIAEGVLPLQVNPIPAGGWQLLREVFNKLYLFIGRAEVVSFQWECKKISIPYFPYSNTEIGKMKTE